MWNPIETAPRDGTAILVYCPDGVEHWLAGILPAESRLTVTIAKSWPGGHPSVEERWCSVAISEPDSYDPGYTQSYQQIEPTHWMPLPAAPE